MCLIVSLVITGDAEGQDSACDHSTSGATFCLNENCWVPSKSCSNTPLPPELPCEASPFVIVRQQCSDVAYHCVGGRAVPELGVGGFMKGPDCEPTPTTPLCSTCGSPWRSAERCDDGHFILRTNMGAVLRRKRKLVCACGNTSEWQPASEYIHTIRDSTEGGMECIMNS